MWSTATWPTSPTSSRNSTSPWTRPRKPWPPRRGPRIPRPRTCSRASRTSSRIARPRKSRCDFPFPHPQHLTMKKAYIIFPLIGLLVFGGFYLKFDRNYTAQQAAIKVKAEQEKQAKLAREQAARVAAMQEAVESSKKREPQRKVKEAADAAQKPARPEADDRR